MPPRKRAGSWGWLETLAYAQAEATGPSYDELLKFAQRVVRRAAREVESFGYSREGSDSVLKIADRLRVVAKGGKW